jgi:hypothetical protein
LASELYFVLVCTLDLVNLSFRCLFERTISYNKDSFIVQRAGRPMAVIVSYDEYQQWRALAKEQVVRLVDEVWQRTQAVPAEPLEADVVAAITTLRQEQASSATNGKP